ncbi:MAG: DUF4358 domain-containing protein [Oscillospiraceae bacterium]
MKKTISAVLFCLLLGAMFAACGGAASGAATGSTQNYSEIIAATRTEEDAGLMPIVTGTEDDKIGMLTFVKLNVEDTQRFALSASLINIRAYAVAIVLPAEGREQAVKDTLNAFVDTQKKAFENYLADQYEIAKGAIVEKADTGEIILVMAENAGDIMQQIKAGLSA